MNISWPALLIIFGALIVVVLVAVLPLPRSRRKVSTPADRPQASVVYRDDDRYWNGGIFYNNPDDPAMFVPKRFGIGWTLNFGHPRARSFMIALLVMILVLGVVLPTLAALFGSGYSTGCHTFGCGW